MDLRSKWAAWKRDIKEHRQAIYLSIFFLAIAVVLDYISGTYVDRAPCVAAPDLILGHIPSIDLSYLFIWAYLAVIAAFFIYPFVFRPKTFHYVIGMLSLFIVIRAGFIILTHLKVPDDAIGMAFPWKMNVLFFSNDLFFSGHAGLPFLGFLIFKDKKIKYFMLAASIMLGLTALLMHLHYSIDVASAFFITYGIYKIGNRIF